MKKTVLLRAACVILGILILCGCGKKKEEGSSLSDKLSNLNSKAEQDLGSGEGADISDDKNEEPEGSKNIVIPEAFISEVYDRDGGLHYDQIHLICEGDSCAGLRSELEKVNEQIADEEKRSNNVNAEWNIYLRRADDKVFSIACEDRVKDFDYDIVKFSGHSYLTENGKELELTDIVDDMDAFYDLLAGSVNDVVRKNMKLYDPDLDISTIDARGGMEDCISEGRYSWVLDPQGVSFWFENINALLGHTGACVLFSDDKEGNVFKKEFLESAPDEWVMQIPGNYSTTFFDVDDDGITDNIEWCANDDMDSEGAELVSGLNVYYDERYFNSDEIYPADEAEWTGYKGMLVHKDKQTVLLTFHYAETDAVWTAFTFKNYMVARGDSKVAFPEWANDSGYNGKYVPTDLSGIKVYLDTGGDETVPRNTELLSVDMDGKITVTGEGAGAGGDAAAAGGLGGKKLDFDPGEFDPDVLANELGGKVCVYEYNDYDGDGIKEAFVIMGQDDDMGGYLPESLWFIDKEGYAIKMRDDFQGMSLYGSDRGYYIEYKDEKKGFFTGECGGYGSGWLNFVYSVKDGMPYELEISMKTEGFYQDEPGVFYTLTDNFDDGHKYLITELIYDSSSGQFTKGKVTDINWLDQ